MQGHPSPQQVTLAHVSPIRNFPGRRPISLRPISLRPIILRPISLRLLNIGSFYILISSNAPLGPMRSVFAHELLVKSAALLPSPVFWL